MVEENKKDSAKLHSTVVGWTKTMRAASQTAERRVQDMKITTKTENFIGLLDVEVGTTGLRGGDAGNGGRTFLRLNCPGTEILASDEEVTMVFGGDLELECVIQGLRFAAQVLEESKKSGTQDDFPKVGSRNVD